MAETFGKFGELWSHMGMSQRVIFLSLVGAVAITMILFFTWLGKEDYTLVYTNLNPQDSAKVIEVLQKRNIDYRINSGGNGILVQASRVGDAKVAMAGEGLPLGGVNGYELFDEQGIGVSEFTQNLNYRRALEGELSRSIATINGVEKARIHLVIPKRTLFREEQEEPTASVVLTLARPGALRGDQVDAIQQLVSSSVPSLAEDRVTILDSFGSLLSHSNGGGVAGLSSAQLETQQELESYLARKAQGALAAVLGNSKALVRVNAMLNFEQVDRTREVVDPEVTAVLSEQRNATTRESDGENIETSTTNYEFNRMIENIIGATGTIKKLTVAVMIDGNYTGEGEEIQYAPRSPQELEGYRKIIENIVGLDNERGDKIEVMNVRFSDNSLPADDGGLLGNPLLQKLPGALNKILFVGALFFLLTTFKKMAGQLVENLTVPGLAGASSGDGGGRGGGEGATHAKESEATIMEEMVDAAAVAQAERQMKMEEQAKAMAIEKPEEVAQLVKTWMSVR